MPAKKRRVPGCERCRERHLKCDAHSPCGRCVERGLGCSRPLKVRFANRAADDVGRDSAPLSFPPHQTWVRTRRQHDFIDQTLEIARSYDDEASAQERPDESPKPSPEAQASPQTPKQGPVRSDGLPAPPTYREETHHGLLTSTAEAELMRRFLDELGPSLDPWDESRRLASHLAEAAIASPALLPALLSAAAAHREATTPAAGHLHPRDPPPGPVSPCNQQEQAIGAAISLLRRLVQNIEGTAAGSGDSHMLHRIWILATPVGPRLDIFGVNILWTGLWQELYISIMHQTPLPPGVDAHDLRHLANGCDDRAWTSRMLLLLWDAVRYGFSEERSTAAYDGLVSRSALWMESRPPSFDPVFMQRDPDAMFPRIWVLNDAVAAGLQYYHLVRIMLTAHNPRVPRLGAARKAAKERNDALLKDDVRTICGVAESMPHPHPAHLPACMAISLVGDRFADREEQTTLLHLLTRAKKAFGWSTSFAH